MSILPFHSGFGMIVVLYDEGMYPSGSAHGMVVKGNPEYASIGLNVIEIPWINKTEHIQKLEQGEIIISAVAARKSDDGSIIEKSIIVLDTKDGKLLFDHNTSENWYVFLFIETFSKGTIRGIHFGEDDHGPNAPASADLLNLHATEKFIRLTHERYYSVLKFIKKFIENGNRTEDLMHLFFNISNSSEFVKINYRKLINKLLGQNYYKPLSKWCEKHNIALTGHPHNSDDIELLKNFHIPGQDIVWRWVAPEDNKGIEGRDSTMAKCSSDAARHMGRQRNANECFGCCGPNDMHWAFSADDMKWYLDWLFVRGVNLIIPHAFYYSVEGEGRYGERPPDVGPNNIWWKYYNKFSDYIKIR